MTARWMFVVPICCMMMMGCSDSGSDPDANLQPDTGVDAFFPDHGTQPDKGGQLDNGGQTDQMVPDQSGPTTTTWAVSAGGTSKDEGTGITVDKMGSTYLTGVFSGTATFGAIVLYSKGDTDIFVAKVDSTGKFASAVPPRGTPTSLLPSSTRTGNFSCFGRIGG